MPCQRVRNFSTRMSAHIFYGSQDDIALTRTNLQLASKILLGITLGYIQDAPLVMVFEHIPGSQTVIDLSDKMQKDKAYTFVQGFQEQSQHEMAVKINELVSA